MITRLFLVSYYSGVVPLVLQAHFDGIRKLLIKKAICHIQEVPQKK